MAREWQTISTAKLNADDDYDDEDGMRRRVCSDERDEIASTERNGFTYKNTTSGLITNYRTDSLSCRRTVICATKSSRFTFEKLQPTLSRKSNLSRLNFFLSRRTLYTSTLPSWSHYSSHLRSSLVRRVSIFMSLALFLVY